MPRSLPPLNALRAFETAARLQSFTRAAEKPSVLHSAISRHVRGLEKRLDVQMFKVAQRGVTGFDQISNRPFYPSAAPGLVAFDGDRIRPEVLAQEWLIGDYIPELWPSWMRAAGLDDVPTLNLTTPMQTLLTIEYAVAGQGVLLLSSDLVAAEVRDGKPVQLSDVGLQSGGYYLSRMRWLHGASLCGVARLGVGAEYRVAGLRSARVYSTKSLNKGIG